MRGHNSLAETDSTVSSGHLGMRIDFEPFAFELMLQTACEARVLKGSSTQTHSVQGCPFAQNPRNCGQRSNQSVMETPADFPCRRAPEQVFYDRPKKRPGVDLQEVTCLA